MNSKNKQTEIKAFLSFILEQSKETGFTCFLYNNVRRGYWGGL